LAENKSSTKAKKKNAKNDNVLAMSAKYNECESHLRNGKIIEDYLLILMMVAIVSILFFGPFIRGLYFPRELLASNIIIFGLFAIWGLFRILIKDGSLLRSPLEVCLVVLIIAYTASFFVAAHKRDALTEVLKNASYLIIFLVAFDISKYFQIPWQKGKQVYHNLGSALNHPGAIILLNAALVSAFAIAVASLGVATGNWDFPFAYDGRRIASPIGYANTAAAYLMAAYLLAIAFTPLAKKWFRSFYLASATILMLTLILTFSRGAWLLLLPLCLILITVSTPNYRLRTILNVGATALTAIPMAFITDSLYQSNSPVLAWIPISVSAVIAVLLGLLIDLYLVQTRILKTLIVGFTAIAAFSVLIWFVIVPSLSTLELTLQSDNYSKSILQQVIQPVDSNELYSLEFEIASVSEDEETVVVTEHWRVLVLAGLNDYSYKELLNSVGVTTDLWTTHSYSFLLPEETRRLEVFIYNESTDKDFEIRSVVLSSEKKTRNLKFIAYRLLPGRFYDRIYSFGRDLNMDRRFELFQDAFRVIKDYPLLGTGGGGWASVYKSYQEHYYNSRQVHNQYLQVWVEAGVFGFLAFVGIWIFIIIAFILNCFTGKASKEMRQLWVVAFIPSIALGAHSLIDWNFAMASVGYFLFVLIGVCMSFDSFKWFRNKKVNQKYDDKRAFVLGGFAIIAGLIMVVYSTLLFVGLHATWRSQELVNQSNLKAAIMEIERAMRLDPLRAENYHNLNVILEEQLIRLNNPDAIQQLVYLAHRAYELEPYNINYTNRYGQILLHYVDINEGLKMLDRSLMINPFNIDNYVYSAFTRLNLAEFLYQDGRPSEAKLLLSEMWVIKDSMEDRGLFSRDMLFIFGRASQLLGDSLAARNYYVQIDSSDRYYTEAQMFLEELEN
jgi:O-antigen ligase